MIKRFSLVSFFVFLGFFLALPVSACPPSNPKPGFTYQCLTAADLPFQNPCAEGQSLKKTERTHSSTCNMENDSACFGYICEGGENPEAGGESGEGSGETVEDCLGTCVASVECNIQVPEGVCASGKVCCSDVKSASAGGDEEGRVVSRDTDVCKTPTGVAFPCPLGSGTAQNISTIVGGIIKWIMGTVGALFLAMFVWGGVLFITAGGSPEQVKKATGTMTSAVIGMVIIVFSFVLVDWLVGTLGSAL